MLALGFGCSLYQLQGYSSSSWKGLVATARLEGRAEDCYIWSSHKWNWQFLHPGNFSNFPAPSNKFSAFTVTSLYKPNPNQDFMYFCANPNQDFMHSRNQTPTAPPLISSYLRAHIPEVTMTNCPIVMILFGDFWLHRFSMLALRGRADDDPLASQRFSSI